MPPEVGPNPPASCEVDTPPDVFGGWRLDDIDSGACPKIRLWGGVEHAQRLRLMLERGIRPVEDAAAMRHDRLAMVIAYVEPKGFAVTQVAARRIDERHQWLPSIAIRLVYGHKPIEIRANPYP
jgi:hypothetical protein